MIESSGWLGILVSGILVEKGEACLFVANALAAVPCQSTVNKGEMKTYIQGIHLSILTP